MARPLDRFELMADDPDEAADEMAFGRRVCSWCEADIGPAPWLPEGQITHGACAPCAERLLAEAERHRLDLERRRARKLSAAATDGAMIPARPETAQTKET